MMRLSSALLAAGGLALALNGCTPLGAVVGAGATVGVAAVQERSVGNAVDDATIQVQINHLLLQKSERLFTDVDLEVVEGRVLMTGSVPNIDDRVDAVRLAWQAEGVKEVLNELQVDDKSGLMSYAKDVWISTQMRGKLIGDGDIVDINYSVDTVNGVLYLMGIAQSQTELDRAVQHARTIRGVTQVVSHVQLKDDPRRRQS
ncbi:MAG: BON domain-containing protein [Alphaproteobacteria bacterium]